MFTGVEDDAPCVLDVRHASILPVVGVVGGLVHQRMRHCVGDGDTIVSWRTGNRLQDCQLHQRFDLIQFTKIACIIAMSLKPDANSFDYRRPRNVGRMVLLEQLFDYVRHRLNLPKQHVHRQLRLHVHAWDCGLQHAALLRYVHALNRTNDMPISWKSVLLGWLVELGRLLEHMRQRHADPDPQLSGVLRNILPGTDQPNTNMF